MTTTLEKPTTQSKLTPLSYGYVIGSHFTSNDLNRIMAIIQRDS